MIADKYDIHFDKKAERFEGKLVKTGGEITAGERMSRRANELAGIARVIPRMRVASIKKDTEGKIVLAGVKVRSRA